MLSRKKKLSLFLKMVLMAIAISIWSMIGYLVDNFVISEPFYGKQLLIYLTSFAFGSFAWDFIDKKF